VPHSSVPGVAATKRKHQSEDVPPSDNDDYSNGSSSSDETEDEDGEELTPAMDAAILRTLAKIKRKDGVYGTENILQGERHWYLARK
jgi:protein KRI1